MTKNNMAVLLGVVWLLVGLWMVGQSDDAWPGVAWIVLGIVLIVVCAIRSGKAHLAP